MKYESVRARSHESIRREPPGPSEGYLKRFCAPLRCSWVYFGVYWVTWNLFRDAFRGFEGSLEGPKAVFIDYWSLFGCSSKGSSGSLGASFGALTQNIDIYGTWGLTPTPFWRPEATIHRYLRRISAWAKTCTSKNGKRCVFRVRDHESTRA